MSLLVTVSVILVLLGIGLISAAIAGGLRLNRSLPEDLRGRWQLINGGMIFFDVAYILLLFMLMEELYLPMELLAGVILLASAIFIFVFIKLAELTVGRINRLRQEALGANEELAGNNAVLAEQIRAREKISAELQKSKTHIENIFNNSIPLCLTNSNLEIVDANAAYYQIFGKATAGKPEKCYESRPGSTCKTRECPLTQVLAGLPEVVCETVIKDVAGDRRHFMVTARPFRDEAGAVVGIVECFQDISRLKMAEQAVVEEKERLQVTLKSIADGVITVDTRGRVGLINDMAQNLTGWPQEYAVERELSEILYLVDQRNRLWTIDPLDKQHLAAGGAEGHAVLIGKGGRERLVDYRVSPITDREGGISGVVLVLQDVTEKRKIEAEAGRIKKLESFGLLAGGVAHDFNNILTAIMNNLALVRRTGGAGEELTGRLEATEQAVLRAKDLTDQLLAFAKGDSPVKEIIDIGDLVKNSVAFCLHGSPVGSDISIGEGLWLVRGDGTQLDQVISNLVINAGQAMPAGGVITVALENCGVGPDDSELVRAGSYVKMRVRDQGRGIRKEYLDKIFDPYFTTKPEGSGLGLATVYSIIAKHGGYIFVDSAEGVGTEFTVYLPAVPGEAGGARSEQKEPGRGLAGQGVVGGRILIMDDEEDIRDLLGELLRVAGFEVAAVADGAEAIRVYHEVLGTEHGFDCVIMDLTIPGGMGGKETIGEIMKIDPAVKAIVSSGYARDPVMVDYRKYGFVGQVAKPYRLGVLLETLTAVVKE